MVYQIFLPMVLRWRASGTGAPLQQYTTPLFCLLYLTSCDSSLSVLTSRTRGKVSKLMLKFFIMLKKLHRRRETLLDCPEYDSLRQKLYFHISENDATFINLTDHDRTLYLLRLDNDNTSQIIAKYAHLMFKKRKQFLSQESN